MTDEKGPAPPPITFSPFVRTSYDLRQWDRSARPFTRANATLPSPTAIMDHAAVVYIYEQFYVDIPRQTSCHNTRLVGIFSVDNRKSIKSFQANGKK